MTPRLVEGRLVKLKKHAPWCAPACDMRLFDWRIAKDGSIWWFLEVPGIDLFGAFLPETALKYSDFRYYIQR